MTLLEAGMIPVPRSKTNHIESAIRPKVELADVANRKHTRIWIDVWDKVKGPIGHKIYLRIEYLEV